MPALVLIVYITLLLGGSLPQFLLTMLCALDYALIKMQIFQICVLITIYNAILLVSKCLCTCVHKMQENCFFVVIFRYQEVIWLRFGARAARLITFLKKINKNVDIPKQHINYYMWLLLLVSKRLSKWWKLHILNCWWKKLERLFLFEYLEAKCQTFLF